jgi:4-oxalocrotonate tautomerase
VPHVIVKLWPGKSDEQKRRLSHAIVRDVTSILNYGDESVSVGFEGVSAQDWEHRANEKWGPALLPAPICAERRIRRCSSALATRRSPAPRSWLTSSGVASARGSQSEDGFLLLLRPFLDQFSFASPASRRKPRVALEELALPAPLPAGPT